MCRAATAKADAEPVSMADQLGSQLARIDAFHAPHAPTPFSAFLGTFVALGGLSAAELFLRASGVGPSNTLLFVGSFGALSTLLYAAPALPLGKPC